jgi:dolichyl-phosphate-mannose-protein mannosyltransferase
MTHQTRRLILGFFILFGFCARAATFKAPLFDHHAWRQADTASIARNFVRERFNILYPQVDERRNLRSGYVETGLELFAFLVAAVSTVAGFHPEIGRLLSAGLFVCSELLVWTFVRRRFGPRAGLTAACLYAFGFPLALYIERAFMNEALLMCLSFLSLVATQRYLELKRTRWLAVLVVASSLIGAIKLPYLIIWAPIVGLFLEADGRHAWRRWELWLLAVVNLGIAAAWYRHAHSLAAETGITFGMLDKLFDASLVASPSFSWVMLTRLARDILGPIGFIGVAAGVWFGVWERRWGEVLGVGGFVAYLVLVARGNYIHDYYQLAVIPIAPSAATLGLLRIVDMLPRRRRTTALASLLGLAALATFVRSVSFHSWYDYSTSEVELCAQTRLLEPQGVLVVSVGDGDPSFLFCIDRKGWLLPAYQADEAHLRAAWAEGARIAIAPHSLENPEARRFLAETGTLAIRGQNADIYRLR